MTIPTFLTTDITPYPAPWYLVPLGYTGPKLYQTVDYVELMATKYQATTTEAVIAARKAERPLCPVCNEPVTRMGNRMLGKTCGKTSCRNALQNGVPATPRCACGKPCVNKVGTTRQFQKTCGSTECKRRANSDRMTKVHAERRGEAA